ncbi:zinc ribbon domain-containing protein [Priestia megaterium]|uniref:zinc ribbon domain-containing protein n=1 Tax=Priestia megaterium TaxID=1404 RepID=UPI0034D5C54B
MKEKIEQMNCIVCGHDEKEESPILTETGETLTDTEGNQFIGFTCTKCGHTLIFNEIFLD